LTKSVECPSPTLRKTLTSNTEFKNESLCNAPWQMWHAAREGFSQGWRGVRSGCSRECAFFHKGRAYGSSKASPFWPKLRARVLRQGLLEAVCVSYREVKVPVLRKGLLEAGRDRSPTFSESESACASACGFESGSMRRGFLKTMSSTFAVPPGDPQRKPVYFSEVDFVNRLLDPKQAPRRCAQRPSEEACGATALDGRFVRAFGRSLGRPVVE
jgi:hypothetical protein